jgi:gluconolactonase
MRRTLSASFVLILVVAIPFGSRLKLGHAQDKPLPSIGPVGQVAKLHSGFKFTEGPAHDADGNVYFSDIPNNRIHKVDTDGKLSTFLEDSQGCNGLMVDAKGRLVACQGAAGKLIAIDVKTKAITTLAEQVDGKPFKGPNDLVIDKAGGVYFTAPGESSVLYIDAAGKTSRIISNLARPNGVILSPDEKTLIVLPSGQPEVMAYPVEAPGKIGKGRVFCMLEQNNKSRPGGDGLTVDTQGNLYFTKPSLSAIQVVSPEGKTLGFLKFPEEPANCTFGGKDLKTLYVTARTSLYTVRTEATGHRFAK